MRQNEKNRHKNRPCKQAFYPFHLEGEIAKKANPDFWNLKPVLS